MSKKKKIALTLLTFLLVLGVGGVMVYNKVTDYLIAEMMGSMLVGDLEKEGRINENGELIQIVGTEGESVGSEVTNPSTPGSSDSVVESQANAEKAPTAPSGSGDGSLQTLTNPQADKPLSSHKPSGNTQVITTQSIEARVKEIIKDIPRRDKNAVMRLVMQNVSSSDISYLSSLVADGKISGSDIAEAKKVALRSFTDEQMKDVQYYYYKYKGLFAEFY